MSVINLPGCHGNDLLARAIVKTFAGQMEPRHDHFSLTDGGRRCRLLTFENGVAFVSITPRPSRHVAQIQEKTSGLWNLVT